MPQSNCTAGNLKHRSETERCSQYETVLDLILFLCKQFISSFVISVHDYHSAETERYKNDPINVSQTPSTSAMPTPTDNITNKQP